jgi:hypothetical protein
MIPFNTLPYRLRIYLDDACHRVWHWYERNYIAVHMVVVGLAAVWIVAWGLGTLAGLL